MEFDEIVVKDSPGLCRCCLSEGCYKDLGSEYIWMGETEVYAGMLLDCFDIGISQHNEGPNGPNRLICEVCITRLRDACNFKKQVLESEKRFVDMVGKGEFRRKVIVYQDPIKAEFNPIQPDETEVEYLDDNLDLGDDNITELMETETAAADAITVTALPVKTKRGRPKKNVVKTESNITKVEEKPRTSKLVKGYNLMKTRNQIDCDDYTTKMCLIREDVAKIVLNSTITPFKWLKTCFKCFFCYKIFENWVYLVDHQRTHDDNDIRRVLNKHYESQIYVDVSYISCNMCCRVLDDFRELLDHLYIEHDIELNAEKHIVPFRMNGDPKCLICCIKFETFAKLIVHIKREHTQTECDKFSRVMRKLEFFKYLEDKTVTCTYCSLEIRVDAMRFHMKIEHDLKYKCRHCTEFFATPNMRSRHTVNVHNNSMKCTHCSRTFVFRSMFVSHMKECQYKEK